MALLHDILLWLGSTVYDYAYIYIIDISTDVIIATSKFPRLIAVIVTGSFAMVAVSGLI